MSQRRILGPCQTCGMGLFTQIAYGFRLLTILGKSSIIDFPLSLKYASSHRRMRIKKPMGVLHSFSIKNIFMIKLTLFDFLFLYGDI